MPTLLNGSIEQGQPDNNLSTPNSTTIELGQDTVSSLELSVNFENSEISLTIIHRPPLEQPVMTTRTRSASFSDIQDGIEPLSLEENFSDVADPEHFPESVPAANAAPKSDSNSEEEAGDNEKDKENGFGSECQESSQESPESSDEDDTTEALAVTLVRRALINTSDARNNPANISPLYQFQPSASQEEHRESTTNPAQLSFFKAPEPSYVLHQTEDGVTVNLTNDVTLKFFAVESEEIEDALKKLPTIAPKLRYLIGEVEQELSQALNCVMWDLSGKKLDKIPEPQEIEDESGESSIVADLDIQVKFTVTATCLGEKIAEMAS